MRRLLVTLLIFSFILAACTVKQVERNLQEFYAPHTGLEEPRYIPYGPTLNEQAVRLEQIREERERRYGIKLRYY